MATITADDVRASLCALSRLAEHWAKPLELVVDLLPGAGHLNVEAGYGPWPAMEAWALGEADALEANTADVRV